jgi:hypothetical protein
MKIVATSCKKIENAIRNLVYQQPFKYRYIDNVIGSDIIGNYYTV